MIYTKEFWKDTLERALYTCAEALLGAMMGTSLICDLDWRIVGISTLTAGAVTVLKCLLVALKKEEPIDENK